MKARYLILFLSFLVFAISCDDINESLPDDPLDGQWHLKNVSGGIQGIDLDYAEGDVMWDFNMSQSKLNVETDVLTTGPKSIYLGLQPGIYAVEFDKQDTTRTITLLGMKFQVLEIGEERLVLDDGVAADGFIRIFER